MTDMEVENIKDVPGYKVILKAVIKSQVQQLFEQLAVHTDEESIVLTASVADGTLSHLGSKSGKGFLDNNEDIKSQFLGYCLRNKHRLVSQNSQETECRLIHPTITGHVTSSLKLMSPEKHSYSSNCYTRSSRIRHKPYANGRTSDRKSLNAEQRNEALISKSSTLSEDAESLSELQDTACDDNVEIKVERLDNFKDACTFKERPKAKNNEMFVKEVSEIKYKNKDPEIFQNEAQELRDNINQIPFKETCNCQQEIVSVSCEANLASHSNDKSQINSGSDVEMIQDVDDTTVKVEEISESELEIEITDVKSLGSQAEEKSNHSTNMTFDPHVAVSGPRDGTAVLTSVDGTTPQSRREPNTLSRDLLFDSLSLFQLQDHLDKCLQVDIRDIEQFGEGSEESDRGDKEFIPTEGSKESHTADEDDILNEGNEKSVTEDENIMPIKDNGKFYKSGDKVYSNTVPLQAKSNDSGTEGELINKSVNQYKHTIMVATCKKSKDGKRLWDKKHSCVYCHKQYLKLARHLEYIHKNEPEVQRALAFEKNSKERKAVWKAIMNKGNFAHNTKVFECKEGEIIPQKRPTKARDASKYVICDICYGTYIGSDMWRHVKNCRPKGNIKNSRKQKKPSGCQCCINASF